MENLENLTVFELQEKIRELYKAEKSRNKKHLLALYFEQCEADIRNLCRVQDDTEARIRGYIEDYNRWKEQDEKTVKEKCKNKKKAMSMDKMFEALADAMSK